MRPATPSQHTAAPALAAIPLPRPAPLPPGTTLEVRLGHSRYGLPTPTIEVRLPRGTHYRQLHIALHQLAAIIEGATPLSERWCVQTEQLSDGLGHVYLELLHATDSEAQRGLALLHSVLASLSHPTPAPTPS